MFQSLVRSPFKNAITKAPLYLGFRNLIVALRVSEDTRSHVCIASDSA